MLLLGALPFASSGLSVGRPGRVPAARRFDTLPAPVYDLNFPAGNTAADLANAGFTFSRTGTAWGPSGEVFGDGVPRLGSWGLLIEGARTNHFTYSNDLANAAWTKVGVTPTTTAGTAPGGAYGSTVLVESAATELHYGYQPFAFLATTAYAWSVYAKAVGGTRWVRLTLPVEAFGTALSANFDLVTGAVTITGGSPTCTATAVGDGWWRVGIAATTTATATASAAVGMAATASGSATYAGNGSSSIRVAFAQLETGSFASSPIPTAGSAVTRNADSVLATDRTGLERGTVVVEAQLAPGLASGEHQYLWESNSSAGGSTNRTFLYRDVTDTRMAAQAVAAGVQQAVLANGAVGSAPNGGLVRCAYRWDTDGFALSAGGLSPAQDASGTVPAMTRERLGGSEAANRIAWAYFRRVRRFAAALDDATLRSLSA